MEDRYYVKNLYGRMKGRKDEILKVDVPGSKSITNRALLLATLADGESTLTGVLFSDDSRHFLDCIQKLGIKADIDEDKRTVKISGCGGKIPLKEASINVGSAGTAARFLSAVLGVSEGTYFLDASEQMRKRPMKPLLDSLGELGCEIEYPDGAQEGHFPFILKSHGFGKNKIAINIDSSSQFLSALMIASVLCPENFSVDVLGSHGMSYIDMTGKMAGQFGAEIIKKTDRVSDGKQKISFNTAAGQKLTGRDYEIEPDVSGAAYFYAMCPLLGIKVCVPGVHFNSLQGDTEFIRILEKMGCHADDTEEGIVLCPPSDGKIRGVSVDMSSCSDQSITLAAIAPFAEKPVTITGIGHIRLQESDRLSAMATELKGMGISVEEGSDYIRINPGKPKAHVVNTYDDHRMAMGFSLTGLRSDGIVIDNPMCCRKTFENYFDKLDEITAQLWE